MVVYIYQCYCLNSFYPLFPLLYPQVCCLCLCLYKQGYQSVYKGLASGTGYDVLYTLGDVMTMVAHVNGTQDHMPFTLVSTHGISERMKVSMCAHTAAGSNPQVSQTGLQASLPNLCQYQTKGHHIHWSTRLPGKGTCMFT